ncbi:glycoside hydrolase family 117 protein [Clostridium beijerinckii]|uniref:glycoside hydrolase family 117 protein n=1 Tax=Clostridium beijerinckii TaxID=1520 RepID=UPI001361A066|nr:family 43 glycosylhydrolase [Clostridium beijerinckii]MZK52065.1 family 43 glycosylhydrolase [Clostridium beijerinckii]MZK60206.1 family 43 glycosylhydrolase [Clostridium beijerinckii]MZK70491.1 family 43 glycosylhydrolase [Clostridium beijerinckii]MZK75793.1 family 43 glycosylhydrolase [Clostridium beijerinckii]MZK85457.1 family 43 glycosylhydrolase [Clostridium beijerinckii]
MKMSSATKRALKRNYYQSSDWFCDFKESDVEGIGFEENVHRRDPSSVIKVGDLYYVWYTKSEGESVGFNTGDDDAKVFPWDQCDIWYATSKDGYKWEEKGPAVTRGEKGEYDDRSVFTPEILEYNGMYYLVYQTVQAPYRVRSFENIAIAKACSPDGPFEKSKTPILEPTKNGKWKGDMDNRFEVCKKGGFDSHKVHDPILFDYKGKFYLYYKGEPMGEQLYMGGRETKWGVAIADNIEGPYVRSEYNPVTNSGHETCLWKYKGGIAAFLRTDGVEKNTIQYAKDGINFEIMSVIKGGPEACGPFRSEKNDTYQLEGMRWGLCHDVDGKWGFIKRFDLDEWQKDVYVNKKMYE